MDNMWSEWKFSPQLDLQLRKFAIDSAGPDCSPCNHLFLREEAKEVISVEDKETSMLCEEEPKVSATPKECANKSVADFNMTLDMGSMPSSSLAEVLEERLLSMEELCETTAEQLQSLLGGLSPTACFHFCQSVCSASLQEQSRFSLFLCHDLLLPKLCDSNVPCERSVLAALQQTVETFPRECCSELLVPLMLAPTENHVALDALLTGLSPQMKHVALKSFLESGVGQLSEWQIPMFQRLVVRSEEERVKVLLVNLLATSAIHFTKCMKFGKLVVQVIEQLGPGLSPDLKDQLSVIISEHKSLMKRVAERGLRTLDATG